jgi:hypothetical protein
LSFSKNANNQPMGENSPNLLIAILLTRCQLQWNIFKVVVYHSWHKTIRQQLLDSLLNTIGQLIRKRLATAKKIGWISWQNNF